MSRYLETRKTQRPKPSWVYSSTSPDSSESDSENCKSKSSQDNLPIRKTFKFENSIPEQSRRDKSKLSSSSSRLIRPQNKINQQKNYFVDGENWDEFDPKIQPDIIPKNNPDSLWETIEVIEIKSSTFGESPFQEEEGKGESFQTKVKTEPLKSSLHKGEGDTAECIDIFNPLNFGYVNLSKRVLKNHFNPVSKFRKRVRMVDESGSGVKLDRCDLRIGEDLEIEPPCLLLQEREEDLMGIKGVQDILESKDLSISQKYRSLGVEEDPWDNDCLEGNGCWQWFLYKVQKYFNSQWPSVSFSQ